MRRSCFSPLPRPFAGRGRIAKQSGEGLSPRVRVRGESPSPRPSPRERAGRGGLRRAWIQIESNMTLNPTLSPSIDVAKPRIDLTKPVLWLFAAFLVVLIAMPLSWLAVYSFTDKARHFTLQNFVTLFTDPDFLDPLFTTAIIAVTSAVICCVVAAPIGWLVSRTDMPGRQTIRALVTASFVTPPFLGAVAWELLAAPNSGLLNQLYRFLTGAEDPLFDIYTLTGLIFVIS